MLTRVTLTIDDQSWPKLHLSGERADTQGGRTVVDQKVQYDLAYSQFENALHNLLRPAVSEIVDRRKANL